MNGPMGMIGVPTFRDARYPSVIHINWLLKVGKSVTVQLDDGRVAVARPEGCASFGSRLRLAWMVFKGDADALVWVGQ